MGYQFNPFTGSFDLVGGSATVPDPLTLDNLTVNQLLTANHIHGNIAGSVYIHVKNLDTVQLDKGTPFYISGTVGASDRIEIKAADNTDPAKGPAVGLVDSDLAVNGEGNGVLIGEIFEYDTQTPGWSANDSLYVSSAGGLTNVEPTTGFRQVIGYVGRVHDQTGTIVVIGARVDPVAGANGQVQFNNDGGFGGSADLTWDDATKVLGVGGDIDLDGGGEYSTTLQLITATANRVISFPDATGTVALVAGSSGQLLYNNAGALAGASTLTTDGTNITLSGRFISSLNGAASAPPATLTGTWFTGGTATTTKPQFLIEPAGTTSTAWSTSGTGLGINAPSGFEGNLLDLQVGGVSQIRVAGSSMALATINSLSGGVGPVRVAGVELSPLICCIQGGAYFGITSGSNPASGDTRLYRDAGNIFAQRNGTNAQTFRLYNTYTSATNFERLNVRWTSNEAILDTEAGGDGGTLRNLKLGGKEVSLSTEGVEAMRINSARAVSFNQSFGTAGQALISNGSAAPPTWQSIAPTAVFGWDHTNDSYGLYLPGTSIRAGDLSGEVDIDVQSRLRRCVINDAGVVQYYLDADDSTKKAGDWLRIVETQTLDTPYTGTHVETTNSLLRVGVPAWAADTFTRGQRVTHNGFVWECVVASTTATPAAGTVASNLTGTDGQVVVEVPAFSVRYGFANGVHTREVRLGCSDSLIAQGFQPHPAFIRTDGTYKSAFYLGAYHAYSDGTNLASVSGQTNTRSLTRATFRSRAALRGTGWHIHSYLEHAAVQTLLVTEYRDHNSQKVVGRGSQEGAVFGVGTGLSNVRGNRSGNAYTVGGANTDYVSYRGIENLWGRAWQWVDGFNVYERVVYLTNNQTAFADDTSVGYRFYTQVPSGSDSYQKEIFPLPDVFLPSVVSGASDTTYLGDAFSTSTGWLVARVGGRSGIGAPVGAFSLALLFTSWDAGTSIGARLCFAIN